MRVSPLPEDSRRFRELVIDACWDVPRRVGYLDENSFIGTCPVCGCWLLVEFAGEAPKARLECSWGCTDAEIAAKLGLKVVR